MSDAAADTIYRLKLSLRGLSPMIWRQLLVPADLRASCWLFAHLRLAGPGRERGMLCLMGRAVGYAGRATPAKTISR